MHFLLLNQAYVAGLISQEEIELPVIDPLTLIREQIINWRSILINNNLITTQIYILYFEIEKTANIVIRCDDSIDILNSYQGLLNMTIFQNLNIFA